MRPLRLLQTFRKVIAPDAPRWPATVWLVALCCLAWLYLFGPQPPTDRLFGDVTTDKLFHIGAFATVTLLACRSSTASLSWLISVSTVMIGCAVGFEWLQGFVPGRDHSVQDDVANLLGIALVIPVWWTAGRRKAMSS